MKKMTSAQRTEVIVSHPDGGAFMADFIAFPFILRHFHPLSTWKKLCQEILP
jgi:hypothetical protein